MNTFETILENHRQEINELDYNLVQIMAQRIEILSNIRLFKEQYNIEMLDMNRFNNMVLQGRKDAKRYNISEDLIEDLLNVIHKHSLAFLHREDS